MFIFVLPFINNIKKMKWNYDSCGEYIEYKKHIIIKQEHPMLNKYAIYKEDNDLELILITTCNCLLTCKKVINDSL